MHYIHTQLYDKYLLHALHALHTYTQLNDKYLLHALHALHAHSFMTNIDKYRQISKVSDLCTQFFFMHGSLCFLYLFISLLFLQSAWRC